MSDYKEYLNEVKEGRVNALEAYIACKAALIELESVTKEMQSLAISEAEKYGAKSFNAFGALVELRNGASTWKYTGSAYDSAKAKLKYVEDIAKAGGGADPNTGEIIEAAVKVEGKSTIAISFK